MNTLTIDNLISKLRNYSAENEHVESVLIVGSYARGTNSENSDIDVVIITTEKEKMTENQSFTEKFGEVLKRQTEYYGACTSIRVWYSDGKEVEFGIVAPPWISQPLDEGTRRVLSDGFRIIADKKNNLKDICFDNSGV